MKYFYNKNIFLLLKIIYKILSNSAGDHLFVIRIDSQDALFDDENHDDYLDLRVWKLDDRNQEYHWIEFENESNLSKSYPFYLVNFPAVIERA